MADKLVIEGLLYDQDGSGNTNKLLDSRDITGGDGIDITRNVDESVTISTGGFGLKVVDGLLCAVYAVEDEG